jgi:DNA helicase II / ATP-dependent DNA helicase PcrA
MKSKIDRLLVGLRAPQIDAVIHRGSPLMIIAGPGSGKTEVLARRVAHLILTGDVSPDKMIVTTFTKKAAWELKDRIQKWLPDENVELMQVSTFHSLCGELLRKYSLGPDASDFRILEESDQLLFVYANRKALGLDEVVKHQPEKFFRSVISAFNLATEEMVDVERLLEWCQNGAYSCSSVETDLWEERKIITEAYEIYLNLLNEQKLLDFALSQRKALDLLGNNDSLVNIRNQYE